MAGQIASDPHGRSALMTLSAAFPDDHATEASNLHHGRMSVSAAHADEFYTEVLKRDEVWAIRGAKGFPAPKSEGRRAMPFWSAKSRAERLVANLEAYQGFEVVAVPLSEWRARWLPGLRKDGVLVGLNWSGNRATGYDLEPSDVERNLCSHESS